jgi:hypothetical protein
MTPFFFLTLSTKYETAVVCAEVHLHVAIISLPAACAHALKVVDPIFAPPTVLAVHLIAVVHVHFTQNAFQASRAIASERIHAFDADTVRETGR